MSRTDVLVVGGGPVGLAAAIEARLAGLSAVVVEPRTAPVDKACGEGLMPGALAAVQRLGVDPPGHVLAGISYRDGRRVADHRFGGGILGRGVRRTTLHAALHERAVALGVGFVDARVDTVTQAVDAVEAAGVRARWMLACDGLHSTVRRITGLETARPGRAGRASSGTQRFGLRQHYRVEAWTDLVEVHWAARVEAYVTPVADDVVGVALLGPRGTDYATGLASVPELAARLAAAEPLGGVRGAGPLRQDARRRTAGRVRLVGDASGYVDALTGEGLRVGLAQAAAAVRHLDDPEAYERAWARVTRDYRVLTQGLVAAATSPARRAIVPLATHAPALYGAVVDRLAR
ncbi:flavin-dependent dehydrogenase [Sediminihabitans luteus]|uniref:Flavin-dependent dehydrogenase n=1 Tax=Sediminihabitans luteus TaxID=1138585 RepID=A0A2M9D125_9CELL|nr:FAD-dependent monooxygenase [Sediminihabitans luteus]PJJ77860.1 flavin-dependent dehydrogenase [Sediminihabitans luteus]GII99782.1 oxidoreductase [Sediminihabitans luteus]